MKPMKLLSSRKSSASSISSGGSGRPSWASRQLPAKPKQLQPASELLQLRLENSDLRSRLDDVTSHTDESKSELLQLLEEQTSQSTLLQRKCDELHRGFVEIDKERRALRKSADDARNKARQQVEQTRGECERRCSQLDRHLKMREKEVETLAERTREQERRIEDVVSESNERKANVEDLERELEELMGMIENERDAIRGLKEEYEKVMKAMKDKDQELEERKIGEENLKRQLKELRETLQDETKRWNMKNEQLTKDLLDKDAEVANLVQDKQLSKIEYEQAIQTMQDQLIKHRADFTSQRQDMAESYRSKEAGLVNTINTMQGEMEKQRNDFASQHKQMTESFQSEKEGLSGTFQSEIDAKSAIIQALTSDKNSLQSNHATTVLDMKKCIQECKDDTQAVEKNYRESLEINSQLQQDIAKLHSSNQIEQEELKATNYLLVNENEEMAKEFDETKVQLADTTEKLSSVQMEYNLLQQQFGRTKVQLADTSEKITAFLVEHETLQKDHASLLECNAELTKKLDSTNGQLVETNELLSGVRTKYATLQLDLDGTKGQLADTSDALNSIQMEREQLKAAKSMFEKENVRLAEELDSTNSILADTEDKLSGFRMECKTVLQKYATLQQELGDTMDQLTNTSEKLNDARAKYATLQVDSDLLRDGHSQLERQLSTLEGRLEQMSADHEDDLSQKAQDVSAMKHELNEEKSVSNKLRSQLRELNIQLKEYRTARQNEVHALERELKNVCEDLSMKEDEANDLNERILAGTKHHANELESLRTEHAAQIIVIETRGADIVSNLEDAVAELKKEVSQGKLENKEIANNLTLEKENGVTRQNMVRKLGRELEIAREHLSLKKTEANDLAARFQVEVTRHATEMESLRTEHKAQIIAIETRGADVVSDFEDVISGLEKEVAAGRAAYEQAASTNNQKMQKAMTNANLEKERFAEQQRKGNEQQQKIASLTAYAKERKEEVKIFKTELARAKHALENSAREREDAVAAVRTELENAHVLHTKDMSNLQHTVENVQSELAAAKERLASEDRELETAKATLSERTNLLRDMVNQTTAYQGDYERENKRANQLDEVMKSYKKQLAEARDAAQHLEHEIHEKDTHFCGAIQIERQQRMAMELELETSHKSMEEALRKMSEVEKENSTLRDKVSRQEKYIGRLQDRKKDNRRVTNTVVAAAAQGIQKGAQPKITRPSSAGASRMPMRNAKERVTTSKQRSGQYTTDENDRPNVGWSRLARPHLPTSPDELDSVLG